MSSLRGEAGLYCRPALPNTLANTEELTPHSSIIFHYCSSETRMREHAVGRPAAGASGGGKEDKSTKKKRNEWRITKMVLAIFLSYVTCYLPITILKIADKKVNYPGMY